MTHTTTQHPTRGDRHTWLQFWDLTGGNGPVALTPPVQHQGIVLQVLSHVSGEVVLLVSDDAEPASLAAVTWIAA